MGMGWRSAGRVWAVWVVVGAAAPFIPYLASMSLGQSLLRGLLPIEPADFVASTVVGMTWLALLQTLVLVRVGVTGLLVWIWLPVTVIAALASALAMYVWGITVPRTLISISAIQESLPAGFPLLAVIFGLAGITTASFVGLGQGIVLAGALQRRSAWGLWLGANVVAATVVGIALGLRVQEPLVGDESTLAVKFVVDTLIGGGLYAAVTGLALIRLVKGSSQPRNLPLRGVVSH